MFHGADQLLLLLARLPHLHSCPQPSPRALHRTPILYQFGLLQGNRGLGGGLDELLGVFREAVVLDLIYLIEEVLVPSVVIL